MWTEEVTRVLRGPAEARPVGEGPGSTPSAAGPLEDLAGLSLADLRTWRSQCQEVESKVSYLRRLVQGRLDLVRADQRRRSAGLAPDDLAALIEDLPRILADTPGPPRPGAPLPTSVMPPEGNDYEAVLDATMDPGLLMNLPRLADAEVEAVAGRLRDLEKVVSRHRHDLFGCIDSLSGELARRYRTGEVSGLPQG
ncbi:MAG: RsiG family protein [Acidimicrobiales bacterium]